MANYITKFKTQADYNTQKYKLDYPNTSYIEGTDEVVLVNAMPDDYALAWLDANGSVIGISTCSTTLTRPQSVRGENVYGIRWGSCNQLTAIGDGNGYVFESMSNLTGTFTIPSGITSVNSAFYNCNNLTVILNNGLTTIGDSSFSGLANTGFIVPDSVTTIGNNAFNNCSSLTSLTIGSGCTQIGDNILNWSSNATTLTVKATTPPTFNGSRFSYNTTQDNTIQIYVPAASVDAYKAARNWSKYASRINAITE